MYKIYEIIYKQQIITAQHRAHIWIIQHAIWTSGLVRESTTKTLNLYF